MFLFSQNQKKMKKIWSQIRKNQKNLASLIVAQSKKLVRSYEFFRVKTVERSFYRKIGKPPRFFIEKWQNPVLHSTTLWFATAESRHQPCVPHGPDYYASNGFGHFWEEGFYIFPLLAFTQTLLIREFPVSLHDGTGSGICAVTVQFTHKFPHGRRISGVGVSLVDRNLPSAWVSRYRYTQGALLPFVHPARSLGGRVMPTTISTSEIPLADKDFASPYACLASKIG